MKGPCEHEMAEARLADDIFSLARLAIKCTPRDVEMYVHRLAYRYRGTPLGTALATIDKLKGVALRCTSVDDEIIQMTEACGFTWQDTESTGWLWHCSLPADHEGNHKCIGACW